MDQATLVRELKDVLESFETALATPMTSGDLAAWTFYVQESWTELVPLVNQQLDHQHREELKQMGRENPELWPRVEKLKAEDDAIRHQMQSLGLSITRLANKAARDETRETKSQEQDAAALAAEGTAFITRVRTQNVAVQTWLAEAFNRENGAGD